MIHYTGYTTTSSSSSSTSPPSFSPRASRPGMSEAMLIGGGVVSFCDWGGGGAGKAALARSASAVKCHPLQRSKKDNHRLFTPHTSHLTKGEQSIVSGICQNRREGSDPPHLFSQQHAWEIARSRVSSNTTWIKDHCMPPTTTNKINKPSKFTNHEGEYKGSPSYVTRAFAQTGNDAILQQQRHFRNVRDYMNRANNSGNAHSSRDVDYYNISPTVKHSPNQYAPLADDARYTPKLFKREQNKDKYLVNGSVGKSTNTQPFIQHKYLEDRDSETFELDASKYICNDSSDVHVNASFPQYSAPSALSSMHSANGSSQRPSEVHMLKISRKLDCIPKIASSSTPSRHQKSVAVCAQEMSPNSTQSSSRMPKLLDKAVVKNITRSVTVYLPGIYTDHMDDNRDDCVDDKKGYYMGENRGKYVDVNGRKYVGDNGGNYVGDNWMSKARSSVTPPQNTPNQSPCDSEVDEEEMFPSHVSLIPKHNTLVVET